MAAQNQAPEQVQLLSFEEQREADIADHITTARDRAGGSGETLLAVLEQCRAEGGIAYAELLAQRSTTTFTNNNKLRRGQYWYEVALNAVLQVQATTGTEVERARHRKRELIGENSLISNGQSRTEGEGELHTIARLVFRNESAYAGVTLNRDEVKSRPQGLLAWWAEQGQQGLWGRVRQLGAGAIALAVGSGLVAVNGRVSDAIGEVAGNGAAAGVAIVGTAIAVGAATRVTRARPAARHRRDKRIIKAESDRAEIVRYTRVLYGAEPHVLDTGANRFSWNILGKMRDEIHARNAIVATGAAEFQPIDASILTEQFTHRANRQHRRSLGRAALAAIVSGTILATSALFHGTIIDGVGQGYEKLFKPGIGNTVVPKKQPQTPIHNPNGQSHPGVPAPPNSVPARLLPHGSRTVSEAFAAAGGPFNESFEDMTNAGLKAANADPAHFRIHRASNPNQFWYEVIDAHGNLRTETDAVLPVIAQRTDGEYNFVS